MISPRTVAIAAIAIVCWSLPRAQAFYSPNQGRWLNRDPIDEQGGHNLYAFVHNAPVLLLDPRGLEWTVTPNSESRADATCDCGDTVDALAKEIKLDPAEFTKWLKAADGKPLPSTSDEEITEARKFTYPNEVHLTQGDSGVMSYDYSKCLMRRKDLLIAVYKARKLKIVDHTPGTVEGQQKHDVQAILSDSPDIYIWAHYGHGSKVLGNLLFWTDTWLTGAPSEFPLHHKLAEIVLYSCAAGQKKSEWLTLVAPGGTLWSSARLISPVTEDFWWSAYSPLSAAKKE